MSVDENYFKANPWLKTLHADGSEEFIQPNTYRVGDEVTFRIRVHKQNPIRKIFFRTVTNGQEQSIEMKKEVKVGHLAYYAVPFKIWTRQFHYHFKVVVDDKILHFNSVGIHAYIPPDRDDFKMAADFSPPSWLTDRIFYQIFPDRFFDGDPSTNVKDGEYEYHGHKTIARKWGEPPGHYSTAFNLDFFGGDLKGILMKIHYLEQLGVNALWLNPIFLSPSNHKYDTQDYHTIDPHIGTEQELIELVKALHEKDIRIILDGVFNHTGSCHAWFNRDRFYKTQGAWQNPSGPYAEYYVQYRLKEFYYWAGYSTLPTLNYQSPKLRDEIYRKENSVAQKYVRSPFSTDGWRLDVADTLGRQDKIQVHHEVWPEFRKYVKGANPEAYIMGECGTDASELLQGDELDGAMNYYGFCMPVRQWLTGQITFESESLEGKPLKISVKEMDLWLQTARSISSFPVALCMYNLLDSHDSTRILYHLRNDTRLLKIGFVFLFSYVGVPAIYYGDEIGLCGGPTLESTRSCMEWDETMWNHGMFTLVQKLCAIRKKSLALQKGGILTLFSDENVYSFARFLNNENWIVILNNNPDSKKIDLDLSPLLLPKDCHLKDTISDKKFLSSNHILSLDLDPYDTLLLTSY